MAVGPLEPVASCVTGGTVAKLRTCAAIEKCEKADVEVVEARLGRHAKIRVAMVGWL